jgi:proteasome assembly chaperone (PAC2) family protein
VDHVIWDRRPEMRDPVLLTAFRGWNDGGEAATGALAYMRERWEAKPFASLDPEEFYDFQVSRPTVRLVDGVTRRIEWPETRFAHARVTGRDVVLFLGPEPNVRWRMFTEAMVGMARDLQVGTAVTLGAFLADVPHTMSPPITGSAGDERKAAELGLSTSRYEGPTGIVGVLHDALAKAGLPSASLWAAVPHYLPGGPNPKAALALVEKASAFLGVPIETDTLERAGESWVSEVSSQVQENTELAAYVRRLEQAAEEREGLPEIAPSGEVLAAELERFLREQRGER